jgi:hypothetical protein
MTQDPVTREKILLQEKDARGLNLSVSTAVGWKDSTGNDIVFFVIRREWWGCQWWW